MVLQTVVLRFVIPHSFVNNGHKGYLEDRRPNSAADPYNIVSRVVEDD